MTLSNSAYRRAIRSSINRRSASSWVSPGPPRKPNPPRWRSRWVQERTIFFFQAEDGIRALIVTGVQTCALPICSGPSPVSPWRFHCGSPGGWTRSEEHTSELQSRSDLVCRLLLEKKKKKNIFLLCLRKKKKKKKLSIITKNA